MEARLVHGDPCLAYPGYGAHRCLLTKGHKGKHECHYCPLKFIKDKRQIRALATFEVTEVRHQADDDSSPSTPGEQLPGPVGSPTGPGSQTTPERFTRQPGQHLPPGLWQSDWSEPTQSEVAER